MNEVDLYKLNCGKEIFMERAQGVLISLASKGYLVSDIGKIENNFVEVCGRNYCFDEVEKIPLRKNLEGRIE